MSIKNTEKPIITVHEVPEYTGSRVNTFTWENKRKETKRRI